MPWAKKWLPGSEHPYPKLFATRCVIANCHSRWALAGNTFGLRIHLNLALPPYNSSIKQSPGLYLVPGNPASAALPGQGANKRWLHQMDFQHLTDKMTKVNPEPFIFLSLITIHLTIHHMEQDVSNLYTLTEVARLIRILEYTSRANIFAQSKPLCNRSFLNKSTSI